MVFEQVPSVFEMVISVGQSTNEGTLLAVETTPSRVDTATGIKPGAVAKASLGGLGPG